MKLYKTRGIVLHTVKYGDSGVVAYLYTSHCGRQTYMVRGVRSSRSKGNKAALFQPMFAVEFEGSVPQRGEMHSIKDMRMGMQLSSLPFDVRKSTISLFMAEVIYRLIREAEPNEHLFEFMWNSVAALDAMDDGVSNFHLWFLVKLSYFLGFYPGSDYSRGDYFDIVSGNFNQSQPAHRMYMNRENAQILGVMMNCHVAGLDSVKLLRTERTEFLSALLMFIGYHADTINAVKSIDILREVF